MSSSSSSLFPFNGGGSNIGIGSGVGGRSGGSDNNDPITYILDSLFQLKQETQTIINSTSSQISEFSDQVTQNENVQSIVQSIKDTSSTIVSEFKNTIQGDGNENRYPVPAPPPFPPFPDHTHEEQTALGAILTSALGFGENSTTSSSQKTSETIILELPNKDSFSKFLDSLSSVFSFPSTVQDSSSENTITDLSSSLSSYFSQITSSISSSVASVADAVKRTTTTTTTTSNTMYYNKREPFGIASIWKFLIMWLRRHKFTISVISMCIAGGGCIYYLYGIYDGFFDAPLGLKFLKKKRHVSLVRRFNSPSSSSLVSTPKSQSLETSVNVNEAGAAAGTAPAAQNLKKDIIRKNVTVTVIVAGSPLEPLSKSIARDLVERGFLVYWTASSQLEEEVILSENDNYNYNETEYNDKNNKNNNNNIENSPRIKPLLIQSHDAKSVRNCIQSFNKDVLGVPTLLPESTSSNSYQEEKNDNNLKTFEDKEKQHVIFAGVILIPDLYYPIGPIECLQTDMLKEALNSKILGPILLLSNGLLDLVREHKAHVLLLTQSLPTGNLNPGFHASEAAITAGLSSLAQSLTRELEPQGISMVEIKMGKFQGLTTDSSDYYYASNLLTTSSSSSSSSSSLKQYQKLYKRLVQSQIRADILSWPVSLRSLYGAQYQESSLKFEPRFDSSFLRIGNQSISSSAPSAIWLQSQLQAQLLQQKDIIYKNNSGSPIRLLHHKIFDILTSDNKSSAKFPKSLFSWNKSGKSVYYCGKGAFSYRFYSNYLPENTVEWMFGIKGYDRYEYKKENEKKQKHKKNYQPSASSSSWW